MRSVHRPTGLGRPGIGPSPHAGAGGCRPRQPPRRRAPTPPCAAAKAAEDASLTTFRIPPPDTSDDLLDCPTIRAKLAPRPSPFSLHNNFGGGFADDGDRVALTSMKFASPESAGATCAGEWPALSTSPTSGASTTTTTTTARLMDNGADDVCVSLPPWAVRAGARETIYFDPAQTTAAIVTCGGLCPGLNDVVQGLVSKLTRYGVPAGNILGVRGGLRGFYDKARKPIPLTMADVESIQLQGGTILGTSRGGADIGAIVRRLAVDAIDMCFVVGGNGGNAAAAAIAAECEARNVTCAVVGVPKSIDNDVLLVDRCFGFETAVQEAQRALQAAKVEAASAYRGVGLVKLMGRQSGFLAMQAAMASGVVDVCLIPEVRFALEGRRGLAAYVESILARQGHAVICVAEGAGQDLLAAAGKGGAGTDASGNPILGDIGKHLKAELKRLVPGKAGEAIDVKLIDPSYMIRSVTTCASDRIYAKVLAHNAVHAAFAGFTGVTAGLVSGHHVLLPIPVVVRAPKIVDRKGKAWNRLMSSIGQPEFVEDD